MVQDDHSESARETMNMDTKKSHCGFVVIKLRLKGESYYLMRKNLKWRDISFIGGHANAKDNGSLLRAARRELLEEVPSLRGHESLTLVPLLNEITHGPLYSPSAQQNVDYRFGFYLLKFGVDPRDALDHVGQRSLNLLVSEQELLEPQKYQIAALIKLLHETQPGGLASIPYSWDEDLGGSVLAVGGVVLDQQELCLR